MKIAFLFPGSGPYEALDNWVLAIGRHTNHDVMLVRQADECAGFDCVFVLTEMRSYPQTAFRADLGSLRRLGVPFGVIHNNDGKEAALLEPGDHPSFCWTKRGQERLSAHQPILLRQPVLPPIVPPTVSQSGNTLVGTFGHIEPKKQTFEMNRWARRVGVPFVAVGPDVLAATYDAYYADLRSFGCTIRQHEWMERIEDLAPLAADCTHFLFVLTDSKMGTGGSPTSPRFAGLFNRPAIVVDDEYTFADDGYYVYRTLGEIKREHLADMKPPKYDWSPDAYLDALTQQTLEFWSKR